jgi:Putative prokaryotic signal transducing protein
MPSHQLVVLRTFSNHIEADLARSALEAAGIESMVRADDAGGTRPSLWVGSGVQLMVRAEDEPWAAEVLSGSASGT